MGRILGYKSAINNGITNCYKFDGNGLDSVGGNNGNIFNNITYRNNGRFSSAAVFNGINSYIGLTSAIFLDTVHSISFWLNPASYNGEPIGGHSLNNSYVAYLNSNSISYSPNFNIGCGVTLSAGGNIPLNAWTHFVIVRDNLNVKLYVNNTLTDTKTLTSNTTMYVSQFGREVNTAVQYLYNGSLDEVIFWNRAVTVAEINKAYSSTHPFYRVPSIRSVIPVVDPTDLTLYLDAANSDSYSGTGNTWYDLSGQNNHCILHSTYTPKFLRGSKAFSFQPQGSLSQRATVLNHSSINVGTGDFTILHYSQHLIGTEAVGPAMFKGARFDANRAGWLITSHAGSALYQVVSNGSSRIEMWWPSVNVPTYQYGLHGLMRRSGVLYHVYNGVVSNVVLAGGTGTHGMNLDSNDDLIFGYSSFYASGFKFNLRSAIIYKRGLSNSEVTDLAAMLSVQRVLING